MFSRAEILISSRNLRPKKKDGFLKVISAFSFLGIMLGVAILIIVMSVMNGFRVELTNKILGFNPHLTIKPYSSNINQSFKSSLQKKYSQLKIVETFNGEGIVMTNEFTKGILIKGSNDTEFLKQNIIDGDFNNFNKNMIIIGKELAINLGVVTGDKLNLMSSAFMMTPLGGFPKQENYEIAAVFSSGFYEFDQNVVFLNLTETLNFFEKSKKDISLEIFMDNPIDADVLKKEIESINQNYYVYSWTDLNKSFFSALKVERNVMFIILALIIVVAAFNIISGLTILIKNKTKEIAILKTLGLSNNSITKSFFLTGFIIGFLATITGIIFGIVFSFYVEEIRFFISDKFNLEIFPTDIYFLDSLPSKIELSSVGIIFIFSIFTTVIASFFPAKIVSKMSTIKALKYE